MKNITYVVMRENAKGCYEEVTYHNGEIVEHSSFEEANYDRISLQPDHDDKLVVTKHVWEVLTY